MSRSLLFLALPVLLGSLSCGQGHLATASADAEGEGALSVLTSAFESTTPVDTGLLERMVGAERRTRYQGVRHLEFHFEENGAPRVLEYTEDVGCDGDGSFAIDTLDVLSPVADPDLFRLLQNQRQVFSFRFRDFKITNRRLFRQNYRTQIVSTSGSVAGTPTVELSISRKRNAVQRYTVQVELRTGLVLAWESRALDGTLRGKMEFESIDFDPDLTNYLLVDRNYDSQTLDLGAGNLDGIVGFAVHQPRLAPAGYELVEARTLVDDLGERWVKHLFTDGISHVAFAHGASRPGAHGSDRDPQLGQVQIVKMGLWNVVTGRLAGSPVLALGQVDEDELFQLLQSAF